MSLQMAGQHSQNLPHIKGTTTRSLYPETSVGCPAIDLLFGGGLPVSGVFIIDENQSRRYASVLIKYYLAEGVINGHSLFLASAQNSIAGLLSDLPAQCPSTSDLSANEMDDKTVNEESLRIAWRYKPVAKINSSLDKRPPRFDLAAKMDSSVVNSCHIVVYPESSTSDCLPNYADLFAAIKKTAHSEDYSFTRQGKPKNLLRIVIEGVGGPLWQFSDQDVKFLARLKLELCSTNTVALITMNGNGMDPERRDALYSYGDAVICLEAVDDEKFKKSLQDRFDGFLRIIRLPTVYSVATNCPPSSDLVFQLQKHKFNVKILHLPAAVANDDDNDSIACGNILDAF